MSGKLKKCICLTCGKSFTSVYAWQKYCSSECRPSSYEYRKGKRKRKKKNIVSLQECNAEAKKLGLSYGKYVAMQNGANFARPGGSE